jgi:4-hydroxyphenylpyruvate dioxygenase
MSTPEREDLGIVRLEAIHFYVHDLARSRGFYTERFGFTEVAHSGPELEARGHQRSAIFEAGACRVICSAPLGEGGRAWRWLKKHPDGVGTLIFEVRDIEHTFAVLERRGGTPIDDIVTVEEGAGTFRTFSLATPFGSSTFRFVERRGFEGAMPGCIVTPHPRVENPFGYVAFDHVTSNFETMAGAVLFLEHVMGFERFWGIEFHTRDAVDHDDGSGLRSSVLWDPGSGVKLALNEPRRPSFKRSQVNIFAEQMRGPGIQHVAIAVEHLVPTVESLLTRGVAFIETSPVYYERLPSHLASIGVGRIDERIEDLARLGILVDGSREHAYLLQIFLRDAASLFHEPEAGPFFFELIERKGDRGFGGGNFRALFESIERTQADEAKGGG